MNLKLQKSLQERVITYGACNQAYTGALKQLYVKKFRLKIPEIEVEGGKRLENIPDNNTTNTPNSNNSNTSNKNNVPNNAVNTPKVTSNVPNTTVKKTPNLRTTYIPKQPDKTVPIKNEESNNPRKTEINAIFGKYQKASQEESMRILSIRMQGFKKFKDFTELKFDENSSYNCIIGANRKR